MENHIFIKWDMFEYTNKKWKAQHIISSHNGVLGVNICTNEYEENFKFIPLQKFIDKHWIKLVKTKKEIEKEREIKSKWDIEKEIYNLEQKLNQLKNIYMKKYCPDCQKQEETIIYNKTTTPEILTCIECWQFIQQ